MGGGDIGRAGFAERLSSATPIEPATQSRPSGLQSSRGEPFKVLSLFAGIGGFDLGLERTGGFRTVAFCEIDPFCQKVLAKHWPGVPCYDDVRELTAERLRADGIEVDIICGGFPCQDISTAGRRRGLAGERSGLWAEICRLTGEVRPRYTILENVAALLFRGLGRVLGDLAEIGYDAEWHCIPAAHLGADHGRDRIWVVCRDANGNVPAEIAPFPNWENAQPRGDSRWSSAPSLDRMPDGLPDGLDRVRVLGNAVVPQIPELIGRAILAACDRDGTPRKAEGFEGEACQPGPRSGIAQPVSLGSPQRNEGEKPRSFDRGGSRRYGAEQSGGSFDHTLTGQRNFAGRIGDSE